uniref:Neurotransmitter-gated ion-channel ligand-binding domain-containing protein n=1 Tax=Trichuris muris TaxID=70415 RepID=A0A5S6Q8S0_TRIMR
MNRTFCSALFAFVLKNILCGHPDQVSQSYWSSKLARDLFDRSNYDRRLRPSLHHNTTINVVLRMNLYLISEVNERAQTIQLYVWTVQMWYDELLQWDPRDYGGVESIVVPYNLVWVPDTYLYNGVEMVRENSERWTSVIITMNRSNVLSLESGAVSDKAFITFRYPAIYKFTCNMNILYFPFDAHRCRMTFGSWMYDSVDLDYQPLTDDVFMEDYIEHTEWSVVKFKTHRELQFFKCCVRPFGLVHADLVIRRKPLFTIVNLIIPTAIINFISMFGFFSPTTVNGDRTEKVTLGITTLLAMSILLLMVSEEMPTTSDFIPLIGWFYLMVIFLIALGTVLSSIVIIVQRQGRESKRLPRRWKVLVLCRIAPKLWVTVPEEILEPDLCEAHENHNDVPLAKMDNSRYYDGSKQSLIRGSSVKFQDANIHETDLQHPDTCEHLREIQLKLRLLLEHIRDDQEEKLLLLEWEFFAIVVDRALLILFNILSVLLTGGILGLGLFGDDIEDA